MNRTDLQLRDAARDAAVRPQQRLPLHCRGLKPSEAGAAVAELKRTLRELRLHTVCEEARCPNLPECFRARTATFMILGGVCTRTCRFCNVATGHPAAVDPGEPGRIAEAVAALGLRHVVVTSVNRDDLPRADQGSVQFARTLEALHARAPGASVEVLTPDFQGEAEAIDRVIDAAPDVYNHNVETVPRLYRSVRPGARYARSLALLERVRASQGENGLPFIKSGLMLGLGETREEVEAVLRDLRGAGVDCVTLGQYLRPTLRHLPVARYLDPAEFESLAAAARSLGFRHVASGPLVRSSFHADDAHALLRRPQALAASAGPQDASEAQESSHVAL